MARTLGQAAALILAALYVVLWLWPFVLGPLDFVWMVFTGHQLSPVFWSAWPALIPYWVLLTPSTWLLLHFVES